MKLILPEENSKVVPLENCLYEMASIGYFLQEVGDSQNKTGFKVYVTNDSRPLSHIHITQNIKGKQHSKQKNTKQKRVCVEFSNPPKYFKHSGYPDSFSPDECREFDTFLRQPYKYPQIFIMGKLKFNVKTYWQYCVYQWKLENDGDPDNLFLKVDPDGFVVFPKQPDYTKL